MGRQIQTLLGELTGTTIPSDHFSDFSELSANHVISERLVTFRNIQVFFFFFPFLKDLGNYGNIKLNQYRNFKKKIFNY